MATRWLLCVLYVVLVDHASPHAILTTPQPRPNMRSAPGAKLTPFNSARTYAIGCGGSRHRDPGVQVPVVADKPGSQIQVQWQLTIPHPSDNLNSGVRVAVHYGEGDSFESNILAGRIEGDPAGQTAVSAALTSPARNSIQKLSVALPAGKTCNYCTLQWIWAAKNDGGSYIGCADVAITTDGTLPDYSKLASEAGNTLAKGGASPSPPSAAPSAPPSAAPSSPPSSPPSPEPSSPPSAPVPSSAPSAAPPPSDKPECTDFKSAWLCNHFKRRHNWCNRKFMFRICHKTCGFCEADLDEEWTEVSALV
eukprot:TRINITY_DN864_c0_g1_i7.p1 TRINITY_DN864_c0_g1~~TRINITY_DN864_c0_g1_i7.p1  ORF type:complete len:308 (-),score=24.34 TRINITY_DN864_c0_g1_i7:67-990(-)